MNLLKSDIRLVIFVVVVALSLTMIATKGLSYGIDFVGGTEIKMEMEQAGDVYIQTTTEVLKNRLNGLGLKSVQVLPEADKQHITIKVSTTNPEDIASIEDILNQQAVFEQLVEGQLCAKGEEIRLDISDQRGAVTIYPGVTGYNWNVRVQTSGEAPQRCGDAMEGKADRPTDLFIDRPQDAIIILRQEDCNIVNAAEADFGYTVRELVEQRALTPVLCYSAQQQEAVNDTLLESLGVNYTEQTNATNATAFFEDLEFYSSERNLAILPYSESEIPSEILERISGLYEIRYVVKEQNQTFYTTRDENSWVYEATGLKSSLSISESLTYGTPIYNSVYEGGAETEEAAREIINKYKIWLTSGNLPIKTTIVGTKPNLPELGQEFLKFSAIIGFVAVLFVSIIVMIRYRIPKVAGFVTVIGLSEVIIILGFASLVSWELDIAAVAGIIAAVGTGVDHQIIITDETLRGERKKKKDESKMWDIHSAISRAFFIIFVASATTISAMLPLMSIIDLRGFAFTTIVGVLIGVFITRPAYAKIVEKIL